MRSLILSQVLFLFLTIPSLAQSIKKPKTDQQNKEWSSYGRDGGGTRFSPLKQINDKNVKQLKLAWTYQTGELKTYTGTNLASKAAFEATPIMIGSTLYFSTPTCRVIAIDAVSGKEKWMYDPKINLRGYFSEVTSRGVSTWPATNDRANEKEARRIFLGTIDGRLIALDALSGKPISSFGQNGEIDLKAGIGNDVSITSPPAIFHNLIIIGSSLGDNYKLDYPPGVVRAYDAVSGQLKWSWNPIPQDSTDKAWGTWKGEKAHQGGGSNAWSIISVDEARDLVFIPTTCPSPDYYGGERKGQNLYGNSIVALRASSGKIIWYYQVVHHDLWDYDIPAQPMLVDIKRNNKSIPAVVVGTKMGIVFVLHRETGQPLFPVEEKPFPSSTVPGEEAYPTQPIPVLPKPLGLQKIGVEDAWGITPKDKEEAQQRISRFTNKGIYTPPSFEGTLVTPGNVGGINWGGMCYDANTGSMITNINWLAAIIRMIPRERIDEVKKEDKELLRAEIGQQKGTPYIMSREYLFKVSSEGFVMQSSPPWGTLLSINLGDGQKKWEVPVGYMLDPNKYPDSKKWGSLSLGGAIVTAGNLVFVAGTRDGYLRAFHSKTGELLWESELPAGGQATPMTYEANGKQYVVIAAGGHGKFFTKLGDYVVAFALE
jgi:quinoprotein glucose dehydrogenase